MAECDERLCDLEYTEFQNEFGTGKILTRCIPHDGVLLYKISATYAKNIPSSTYYYLGRSIPNVKKRFASIFGYMKITSVEVIPPGIEAETILTDRMKMPMR